jgi:hypothetical protein
MMEMFSKYVLQGQELLLHPVRMSQLKHVLNTQLKGNFENWERVCQNITKSKFLMGEAQSSDFKATLDWVITKDHAIKIFEGNAYGIGDRVISNTSPTSSEEAQELLFLSLQLPTNILFGFKQVSFSRRRLDFAPSRAGFLP